ncbi:allophanate hydrolase [Algiphilus sp.]|uniref:allophanate hydrolase n=1 Tax=Algiphilus sp. TaxID=1872431 RepID=UPI0025C5DC42|nr:allophanate hydrolase [Algiphilus sp.]MCK5768730.1 allophanate hydrolase [Algiphilus sp.]
MAKRDAASTPPLLDELRRAYADDRTSVAEVIERCLIAADEADACNAWIHRVPADELRAIADAMDRRRRVTDAAALPPLYGIPFAVKDNIDVAGMPTSAGCPDFTFMPAESARVVARLQAAGAILIGKTNLDQFATGLVGTRSPFGACRNPRNPDYIAGGSSSGSAIAVACGAVPFALGTDTAGSGRVPAALNNIVGLKPSRGMLSNRGVFPACRSLDCVSVFALCVEDAYEVLRIAMEHDAADPFARACPPRRGIAAPGSAFRFGVPRDEDLEFYGDADAERCFADTVRRLVAIGGQPQQVDFRPFREASCLLYEGPWIAERYLAVRAFLGAHPESMIAPTREIIGRGAALTAADAFAAYYRLQEIRRRIAGEWDRIDCLVTPTVPTTYRIADIAASPVELNSRLGYYTNNVNLLDLCAMAVPAGFLAEGQPYGVTLSAPAFSEQGLYRIASDLHRAVDLPLGASSRPLPDGLSTPRFPAPPDAILLSVSGAHMAGLPLNHQLTSIGAVLEQRTQTAPCYRLYSLDGFDPPRPGMVRDADGVAIEVEVWAVPREGFGGFVDGIPAPLAIGTVELADGRCVNGFVCEPHALTGATDISACGGWRRYLERGAAAS